MRYLEANRKGHDQIDSRWRYGIWLGVRDESGECTIVTNAGVVRARDLK